MRAEGDAGHGGGHGAEGGTVGAGSRRGGWRRALREHRRRNAGGLRLRTPNFRFLRVTALRLRGAQDKYGAQGQ